MAEVDYGYGDQNDYGYGASAPDNDMGYGVVEPDLDYGYGDATPDTAPVVEVIDKRPKRRCSVTKFSLVSETPLTAASVINDLRMGLPATPLPSAPVDSAETRSGKSAAPPECAPPAAPKKNGMISRIRRRLSVVG
jgi:hypothetical protein